MNHRVRRAQIQVCLLCFFSVLHTSHWGIFCSYGDITIADEGLQILCLCLALEAFEHRAITCCDTCMRPGGFFGLNRRTAPFSCLLWHTRLYRGPIVIQTLAVCVCQNHGHRWLDVAFIGKTVLAYTENVEKSFQIPLGQKSSHLHQISRVQYKIKIFKIIVPGCQLEFRQSSWEPSRRKYFSSRTKYYIWYFTDKYRSIVKITHRDPVYHRIIAK
jgi:hypothetical protein